MAYSFAGVNSDGTIRSLNPYKDIEQGIKSSSKCMTHTTFLLRYFNFTGNYKKFNQLKSRNPKLQTVISVGGWNEGSIKYPCQRGGGLQDKVGTHCATLYKDIMFHHFNAPQKNFVLLLNTLRQVIGGTHLITVAVGASQYTIQQSYDVPNITK